MDWLLVAQLVIAYLLIGWLFALWWGKGSPRVERAAIALGWPGLILILLIALILCCVIGLFMRCDEAFKFCANKYKQHKKKKK